MSVSAFAAREDSRSPNVARGSDPPSTSTTRTVAGSMVRKFPVRVRVASSRSCPASSTPVGPAPTTTIVSQKRRWTSSVELSASSNAP